MVYGLILSPNQNPELQNNQFHWSNSGESTNKMLGSPNLYHNSPNFSHPNDFFVYKNKIKKFRARVKFFDTRFNINCMV